MKLRLTSTLLALALASVPAARADAEPHVAQELEAQLAALQHQIEAQTQVLQEQADVFAAQAGKQHELLLAAVDDGDAPEPPEVPEAPEPPEVQIEHVWNGIGGAFDTLLGGPSRSGQPLVAATSTMEPKRLGELQEDLTVMSHLLGKSLDRSTGRKGGEKVMGITMFGPLGNRGVQSLYLEGYGALFLLNVRMPLMAPPAKEATAAKEDETDRTWEAAKREVYGRSRGGGGVIARSFHSRDESQAEFDSDKVEALKKELIGCLKKAGNIRNLRENDSVTIVVRGGAAVINREIKRVRTVKDTGDSNSPDVKVTVWDNSEDAAPKSTTMVLQARQADIAALTKGRLNDTNFADKVKVTAYCDSPTPRGADLPTR